MDTTVQEACHFLLSLYYCHGKSINQPIMKASSSLIPFSLPEPSETDDPMLLSLSFFSLCAVKQFFSHLGIYSLGRLGSFTKQIETLGEMSHVWRICEWRFWVLSLEFLARKRTLRGGNPEGSRPGAFYRSEFVTSDKHTFQGLLPQSVPYLIHKWYWNDGCWK